MTRRKLLRILAAARAGSNNISFSDMIALVEAFGFRLSRVSGSHHIFSHPLVQEQVYKKSMAKQNLIRLDSFYNWWSGTS